jgi:hypothetical protein
VLTSFRLATFTFRLTSRATFALPAYKGSTLRGAFGHSFKRVVCMNRAGICRECTFPETCPYAYIFETPPPADAAMLRKYPHAPHPYVIEPSLDEQRIYRPGDVLIFRLVLVGKAIDYLPYFIYTFDELAKDGLGRQKGVCVLEEVASPTANGEEVVIFSGAQRMFRNLYRVVQMADILEEANAYTGRETLRLVFHTPTRLKFAERLVEQPEFHMLVRTLLRRISTLAYFHCGERLEVDFRGLIEEATQIKIADSQLRWVELTRYSNRQRTEMLMGGFQGTVTYAGRFDPFLPFLLLGQHVHVGKGTVYGLGKYKLE